MILGIDLETTGLDTATCEVIEVGAVLWDEKLKQPISLLSEFINGPVVPPEITEITGIRQEYLSRGITLEEARLRLHVMCGQVEWVVAHNGTNYDKPIFERQLSKATHLKWIDTSVDIPYPKHITTRKLSHLAAEHGFANPFRHRALFDVLTMLKVLSEYDFEAVAKSAAYPPLSVIANVSYDDREKAKARGYRWDSARKIWLKTLKEPDLERERTEAGFPIRVMGAL
jgi:DNA polymerase-3 subunit epsilon